METYFVVRDTAHPSEDLARNWSGFSGGSANGEEVGATEQDAKEKFASHLGVEISEVSRDFRYHPAYEGFVAVDYEGLGAFVLDAETKEEAIIEATNTRSMLACTMGKGDGHFLASDVVAFHKVSETRYVFELK